MIIIIIIVLVNLIIVIVIMIIREASSALAGHESKTRDGARPRARRAGPRAGSREQPLVI